MFVEAIETAAKYTRAIHSISRNYGSTTIQPGTATLFFVNSDGWALTCIHVADQLVAEKALDRKASDFKNELFKIRGTPKEKQLLKEIEEKYKYKKSTPFELHNLFMNCVKGRLQLEIIKHKELDIALLKFKDYDELRCDSFPTFPSDSSILKQGKVLCRLGFPFPEFTNFTHDKANDSVIWTDTGRKDTPRFPIEGMLTRHVGDNKGNIIGFELSTPGLRGQSGGPAFDIEGKVCGVQFQTAHLDLNFDVDQQVLRKGLQKRIRNNAFLHVGRCIHVDVLKSFMKENNVSFTEA